MGAPGYPRLPLAPHGEGDGGASVARFTKGMEITLCTKPQGGYEVHVCSISLFIRPACPPLAGLLLSHIIGPAAAVVVVVVFLGFFVFFPWNICMHHDSVFNSVLSVIIRLPFIMPVFWLQFPHIPRRSFHIVVTVFFLL